MHQYTRWLMILLSLSLFSVGCSKPSEPDVKKTKAKASFENRYNDEKYRVDKNAKVEIGIASYYANAMNGRRTASGEIYDTKKYTAAHRSLPLGTMVRVTMLQNGKSVIVKVNDRGSYVKGRVIDLSWASAQKLGLIRAGIAKVKIEKLEKMY
ncbi:MAG TPA: septal ring lytic transglycosylase RlpA family protein [Sulfurovum sp.]|uniref:septal ring lytic transglycosylase RlpA family protein n=1 Tax=Sulfurovum sp. TaxID=1969726 RepID=UPI002F947DE0